MSESEPKLEIRRPLEEKIGEEQKGKIKVGSQIINQLSKNIYSSPEMALKELISNAFDADAEKVTIDTKSKPNCIVIRDDGTGMDYKSFDENFTVISRSPKTDGNQKTPIFGRPVIGRLGIGFIAVAELCNTMIISSTTEKSKTKFIATIDFSKFKKPSASQKDFEEISDYVLVNYKKNLNEKPYTHIELRDLTPALRHTLENKSEKSVKFKRIKKDNFTTIVKTIWNNSQHLEIGKTYGPYWKFMISLAGTIPVSYLSAGPITNKEYEKFIQPIKDENDKLKFKVIFDKIELRKPFLFPTKAVSISKKYSVLDIKDEISLQSGKKISYHGYVYSQDGGIFVDDWRGLIVRVKNTSIGPPSQNFLDYPFSDSMYFKWTFGEIYVDEGLTDAMHIDRATFKKSDPEYYEFTKSLHKKLQSVVFESVQKRWRTKVKKESANLEDYKQRWRLRNLTKTFNKNFEVITDKTLDKPVEIDLRERLVKFNTQNKILQSFSRKERELIKDVILAVTIAREKYPNNSDKQESLFLELLENLAKSYPKQGLKYDRSSSKSN